MTFYKIYIDTKLGDWKMLPPIYDIMEVVEVLDDIKPEHYMVIRNINKGDENVTDEELDLVRLEKSKNKPKRKILER